ncbi:cobalamin biosynthesis protein CobQ [Fischerella thermalis]|uniref:Cobalamin biosynthesis protein CobQ n=1 Tax=Fischerella thermalis CCMEE 5318 TaxID=2019666 RepID=A0A2N6LEL3_9CYAN|nr:cobalamin biosynthesis protein CobQ [Fischerella thermalis]PMB21886.1 cobalamin biosynthesis protein CobQ [Fischerella thermalis CCMEE 5318]
MKFTQRKRGRPKKNVKNFSALVPLSPLEELKTMQPQTNFDYNSQSETIDESLDIEINDLGYEFDGESSSEELFNEDKDSIAASVQSETTATEAELRVEQELLQIPLPLKFPNNKEQKISTKSPTTIHLIDGEKGGCGKSFLSRAFIEYCISIGLDTAIVDADISNKDISKIYSGVETAFFSDDEKQAQQADKIFDLAFEKSVIVNLPAQVYTNVTQWIQRNDLIELGKENSITFVKWFVCTGGVDSVNFFLESLEDLGNQMLHVFVRNWGMCDDWKYIDEMPEFIAAKTKYNFTVMDLPKFPFWERNQVDRLGATFEDALAHHELGVVSKQRVKNFLKQAYAAFKETGLVR